MTSRNLLIVIAVLIVAVVALDVTGLVPGAGRYTLPFMVLLIAAVLGWRAMSPQKVATTETLLSVPLGGAQSASLDVKFGAGVFHLTVGDGDWLLSGTCAGSVKQEIGKDGVIMLRQPVALVRNRADWRLTLAGDIPWRQVKLMLGASDASLDLRGLHMDDLVLETGGTTLDVLLPEQGRALLHISGGEAVLRVPVGIPAVVVSEIRLGEVDVDEAQFVTVEDGVRWTTPGYVEGADALHVVLKGGLGTVRVLVG